jgi:hypothetical protein
MSRFLAPLFAMLALALAGCARGPDMPPPGVKRPAPAAPDPRICAPIEGEPAPDGGIVQPVTAEQRRAVERFLDAEIDVRSWGRRGWGRASLARDQFCRQ